jgi:Ribonuclease G/E
VVEVKTQVAEKYELAQNYPNPFNPTTTIKYRIVGKAQHVVLTVYNTLGQKVATLVNKVQNAGGYSVSFKAGDLPTGIYFYRLRTKNFLRARKMILLK